MTTVLEDGTTRCCRVCQIDKPLLLNFKLRKDSGKFRWECNDCNKLIKKSYYSKNKEKIITKNNEWFKKYPQRTKEIKRKSQLKNMDKIREKNKEYDKMHQGARNARTAKRRAEKHQATPKWLSKEQLKEIKQFYIKARELFKIDGIRRHVDHIVPLLGENVRGLHVPWNLQILKHYENESKGNKLISGDF